MVILYGCLGLAMAICAILALYSKRLLTSSLWLAVLSALLAVFLYLLGATRVAAIELSVGAGLVTVLLVFAIGLVGEEGAAQSPLVPRPLALAMGAVILGLLGWFVAHLSPAPPPALEPTLARLLWQDRALDVLIQVVLIFCGVLGVLGLLTEEAPAEAAAGEQTAQVPQEGPEPEPAKGQGAMQL